MIFFSFYLFVGGGGFRISTEYNTGRVYFAGLVLNEKGEGSMYGWLIDSISIC